VVVERLKLDFDIGRLHDFVDLAVLLSADEVAVFVRQFNLEADLVMEVLPVL